tara:strand:- start:4 stop:372 length:369 start_codon:yes stop_codon:yes gene_type:complete
MGVTFNLVDQGTTRTGVYCHITDVMGPKKIQEVRDDSNNIVTAESWYSTYGVIIHQNQSARNSDTQGWPNRIPSQHIDRFKWSASNLTTYPTLAVLYADLKTEIAAIRVGGSAIVNTVADAV